MKITGAKWTPKVNFLEIKCFCGKIFTTRADRFAVACSGCGKIGNLAVLRKQYQEAGNP